MEFTNSFTVDKPIDEVWGTITNLEKVVPMVPGAKVLEGGSDSVKAEMKIRLGSMSMTYVGPAKIVEQDDSAHRAVMSAQAKETGGQGNADAKVEISLSSSGNGTEGQINSNINVTGKAAQMGEGVIAGVTENLINEFSGNMSKM